MFGNNKLFQLLAASIEHLIGRFKKTVPKATYVTVEEASKWLRSGDRINVVDIRSPRAFSDNHIPGAISIPLGDVEDVHPGDDRNLKAETPILVYCVMGISSDLAGTLLLKNGFKQVYQLEGGFMGWNSKQ